MYFSFFLITVMKKQQRESDLASEYESKARKHKQIQTINEPVRRLFSPIAMKVVRCNYSGP